MISLDAPNLNFLWSRLMIEELYRCGVADVCIAPGSRSAPLSVAAAQHQELSHHIHFDERGLAFFALGMACSTGKPVVLICTSGTATANFLPGIIEASKKKIPLIILTADRPPELQQTGAPQTIQQTGLFSSYVRWETNLPCPDPQVSLEYLLTTIDQACSRAMGELPGPIHINCQYREPLSPTPTDDKPSEITPAIASWQKSENPFTRYVRSKLEFHSSDVDLINDQINSVKNGIIVCGKLKDAAESKGILQFAERLNWPIFPDITSGLRLATQHPLVIHHFDQILQCPEANSICHFDGVLHFGGRLTSKRWYELIELTQPKTYIMTLKHPLRSDPTHNVTVRFQGKVGDLIEKLLQSDLTVRRSKSLEKLQESNEMIQNFLSTALDENQQLTEPAVCRLISKNITKDSILFLGNSMPVRDMDMFAHHEGPLCTVTGNRGASGIDGNVASAAGWAAVSQKPVTALVGDMALLHDLNSLSLLKKINTPFIIMVINNDGGGIFSFLPIVKFPHVFEECFGTPHGFNFADAASQFGLRYTSPKTLPELKGDYQLAQTKTGATLIEIQSNRQHNLKIHQQLSGTIDSSLKTLFR